MRRCRKKRLSRALGFLRLLPVLAVFAVGSGCGLPTEAYLYAPERTTDLNLEPEKMTFVNSGENDADIFLGYLVFYKFYFSAQDDSTLEDYGDSFFTTSTLNSYDVDNERGIKNYVSLFKVIDVPYGNRTDTFEVMLDFSSVATGAWGEYPNGAASPIDSFTLYRTFQRASENDTWQKLGFSISSLDYEDGDTDLSDVVDTGTDLTCAVWAVAFGFDIYDTFQNVYSDPVYVGQFTISSWN